MKNIESIFKKTPYITFKIAIESKLRACIGAAMALACLLVSPMASSTGYTVDTAASPSPITGLWWNQNESGWGVTLTQQYDVIFVTMYTYDGAGNPTWYVASNCAVSGGGCQGDLYKVTGGSMPTVTWNGNNKAVATVGTITLAFTDTNTGTMNYVINGVTGSKTITRQVWRTAPPVVTQPVGGTCTPPQNLTPNDFSPRSVFQTYSQMTSALIGTWSGCDIYGNVVSITIAPGTTTYSTPTITGTISKHTNYYGSYTNCTYALTNWMNSLDHGEEDLNVHSLTCMEGNGLDQVHGDVFSIYMKGGQGTINSLMLELDFLDFAVVTKQ